MTIPPALLPPGFRDRLPPAAEAHSALVRLLVDRFAARGYERVAPPLVEHEGQLTYWLGRPSGALFRSSDPTTGAGLALRPDITGQVARIAATRMAEEPRPLRLAYAGPVFRARAGQLSPARELTQAGAELIGTDNEAALAELIETAAEALKAAGVSDLSVDLTTPELVAGLAVSRWPVADPESLLQALDGKDWGALASAEHAPYRALLEAAGPADSALPALARIAPELADRLAELARRLAGLRITIDPTERHGFEYQSWVGFSLFGAVNGEPLRAEIGRGGAYAIRHPDGCAEPAAGISLYVDPLVDAGLGRASAGRRLFLPWGTAPDVAARFRAEGWVTITALDPAEQPGRATHVWNGTKPVVTG